MAEHNPFPGENNTGHVWDDNLRELANPPPRWWMIAFWIQFWHHIEHAILQSQVLLHHNLFRAPVPMSLIQLIVPRVELHLFYNTIVFIPMVIAMFFHMFPLPGEEAHAGCSCAWQTRHATVAS